MIYPSSSFPRAQQTCPHGMVCPCPDDQELPHSLSPWSREPEYKCCFVLLIPTPEEYRVPRVSPGVTTSKLFSPLLPSLATPGPSLPYRPLQKARYYYPRFRVRSSICLASSVGCAEGAGGSPFRPWWLRWISCSESPGAGLIPRPRRLYRVFKLEGVTSDGRVHGRWPVAIIPRDSR